MLDVSPIVEPLVEWLEVSLRVCSIPVIDFDIEIQGVFCICLQTLDCISHCLEVHREFLHHFTVMCSKLFTWPEELDSEKASPWAIASQILSNRWPTN